MRINFLTVRANAGVETSVRFTTRSRASVRPRWLVSLDHFQIAIRLVLLRQSPAAARARQAGGEPRRVIPVARRRGGSRRCRDSPGRASAAKDAEQHAPFSRWRFNRAGQLFLDKVTRSVNVNIWNPSVNRGRRARCERKESAAPFERSKRTGIAPYLGSPARLLTCYCSVFAKQKRRGGDSNPRNACAFTAFPVLLLQPLGHLSRWLLVQDL